MGSSTTSPVGSAANRPNAGPLLLASGVKKPDAKTTAAPPPRPERFAWNEATMDWPEATN